MLAALELVQVEEAESTCSMRAGYEASPFVKLTREVLPTPTAGG